LPVDEVYFIMNVHKHLKIKKFWILTLSCTLL
jgi:hypothetical protein